MNSLQAIEAQRAARIARQNAASFLDRCGFSDAAAELRLDADNIAQRCVATANTVQDEVARSICVLAASAAIAADGAHVIAPMIWMDQAAQFWLGDSKAETSPWVIALTLLSQITDKESEWAARAAWANAVAIRLARI